MLFPTVSRPSTHSSLPYRSFPPNSPQAISHGSRPSTFSLLPYRSFPTELSPSYFAWFPFRPPSRRFRIAPSPQRSPEAISHGFPPVHTLVPSGSLLPTEGHPSYISHCFPSVQPVVTPDISLLPIVALPMLFPTVSPRPPSRHSRIAPSDRTLPKLFPTVSLPSTLSSFTYRSFPSELSPLWIRRKVSWL